ncbi:MAG: exodeoxyribonuclease VII small subunit [bacterium]
MKKEKTLGQILKELEEIVSWFDTQSDIDLEEGLKKVKAGNELVKISQEKLKEAENEFKEISGKSEK